MILSNELFYSYYSKRISRDEFIRETGIGKKGFTDLLYRELKDAYNKEDETRVEFLLGAFSFMEQEKVTIEEEKKELFVLLLDDLLLEKWHHSHEDIVLTLEFHLSSDLCLPVLFEAIELHPDYLAWDSNFAFEVKCVRAFYYIGGEKGRPYLEKLCKHCTPMISEMAQRQLKKLEK